MISFWKKRTVPGRWTRDGLREIAETTLRYRDHEWIYREGVLDEAVKRAMFAKTTEEVVDAIESTFLEYELGRRDERELIGAQFGLTA